MVVFNDPELIPLLSQAFMPAQTQPYEAFLCPSEFSNLSISPTPSYTDTSQYSFNSSQSGPFQFRANSQNNGDRAPPAKTFITAPPSSTSLNDTYEAEVQREMKRRMAASRQNIYVQLGEPQSTPQEEELNRRLQWAQQMILSNPVLCAKACQASPREKERKAGTS